MRMNLGGLLPKSLIGLMAFAAVCGASLAQGTLDVLCLDENGKPIKDVQVFLQPRQGQGQEEDKKTNKRGVATFKKVQGGIYRVIARGAGYDPGLEDLYRFPDTGDHRLQLTFKPGDSEKNLYFEDEALQRQANQLITDAVNDFRAGNIEAAEQKLKESLEIFPASPDAQQNLGLIYLNAQRWEEGEAALRAAADLIVYYIDLNVPNMAERREQILKAIDLIPLQKIAVQTEALMKEKRYDEAIPLFEEMDKISPANADVFYNMALALAHSERLEEAKATIAKALELSPDDQAVKNLRQQIQDIEESGHSLKAQEAIQAIERDYRNEKYQQVLEGCEKAFQEIKPEYHASFWILKARAHAKQAQPDEAIDSYRKAVELKPQDSELKEELAEVYIAAEKYQQWIELYSEVLKGGDKPADQTFFEMAQGFNLKGKANLAGLLFQKVLEVNPDYAEAYYELGIFYFYETKDRGQAKKMLDRYLETGQDQNHKDAAKSILTVMEKTQ